MTEQANQGKPGRRYVFSLVAILIIAILVVIFTMQNSEAVDIQFGLWELTVSLALILFGVLLCGVLLTVLVSLPGNWRKRKRISSLEKSTKSLQAELDKLKAKAVAAGQAQPNAADAKGSNSAAGKASS